MAAIGKCGLGELLGPGGTLSRVLRRYEPRPAQLEMAEKVAEALGRGQALVVEAGTGTGKTLAYLVPAARSGLKVVVSTATKALQDQLAEKDVPLLKDLGVDARIAFLKGRQNYLCLLRKDQLEQNPTLLAREEAGQYEALARWALETEEGDKAELDVLPEGASVWREVTSTAETCIGQKCPHYDRCFVFRARRRAAEADVVVVNHHLFFADLALRTSSAGDQGASVLPSYDAVIFDEAHAVEDTATEHFGAQVSSHRVAELARDVLRVLGPARGGAVRDLASRLAGEGQAFFSAALECRPAGEGRALPYPYRHRGEDRERDGARFPLSPGALSPAEAERAALVEILRALAALLTQGEVSEEMHLLDRRCSALASDLDLFAAPARQRPDRGEVLVQEGEADPGDGLVRWAEARGPHLHLHASPLDIGSLLQDRLYDRVGPVVFTSATLSVGGRLSFFKRRVGLADEEGPVFPTAEAILASPFDYETNAALYLPAAMPEPSDPSFLAAVASELRGLCAASGGRAFALFTSLRNMRDAHDLLALELGQHGVQVLLQGERPKVQLLRSFKERPSVLFASQSFWEGVDVPGDALRLVVIDKLPFAPPGEPIVAARIERLRARGEEPFLGYQVPQAALALKQGFGRLIRTAVDRGVVAILDPRLLQKRYGRIFLATLPRCRLLRSVEDVSAFLGAADPSDVGAPGAG